MSNRLFASVLAAAVLLASTAAAQFPGPGLSWAGSSGTSVRGFLPACTDLAVAATRGETVTVTAWGDVAAPFALFIAPSATSCAPWPGLDNALVLDPPFALFAAGVLTRTTPCLSCPPGYEDARFVIPFALPPGLSVALQAVSLGAGRLAFTVAVTGTIV